MNELLASFVPEEDIVSGNSPLPGSRELRMDNVDRTIKDVLGEVESGKIIIDPDFQRNYIWNDTTASLLIESLLINIPIPNIYLSETIEGKWEVIDGVQRLTSLLRFYRNEYKLKGLEILNDLNDKDSSALDADIKNYLDDKLIRYVRIKKESSPEIKFDIFMRLNQGSARLSEQELRNCLYRGDLNALLKEIADNNPDYEHLLDVAEKSAFKVRMKSVELLLRFLAFSESVIINSGKDSVDITNYNGTIKNHLNQFIEKNLNNSSYEILINDTLRKCMTVFGDKKVKSFRLIDEQRVNLALAECQLVMISKIENTAATTELVYEAFEELLTNDSFISTISSWTNSKANVQLKYDMILAAFREKGILI